ncbi:MAG: Asp-tRNA(Asn)/Glu-tRNA(Gln) amidotransferase subunit GatB [Syntrophales bacterium]|nr:Asp-tRNA(Asn)/Glu-tRNA(Gln) amidotransferase subunit GatB [Syntrophales bacterium]
MSHWSDNWELVVGLEVHAQLLTASKAYSSDPNAYGDHPNTNVSAVTLGLPGTLPVPNTKVIDHAIRLGLAVGSTIAPRMHYARKNYFYPDLPKGYQITQDTTPICRGGHIMVPAEGGEKRIGITRIHMEEDAGKLVHDERNPWSYVDFNRTGVPLIEIVSEPDMRSPEEAGEYLRRLRDILVYLEICDGNMEEGSFRCDANVSIRPRGQEAFGTRTELKNMNSFRNVQRALEYEIKRQQYILESGGVVIQETRLWDDAQGQTHSMRSKEEAHDYRYFPDPDLVPILISSEWIEEVRRALPELPLEKQDRFIAQYGIPVYDASVLTTTRALADFYEEAVKLCGKPKIVSNWVMGDLLRYLNEQKREIKDSPVTPAHVAEMINLIENGTISGKIAKEVFEEMVKSSKKPAEIVKEKGLTQITDEGAVVKAIEEAMAKNPAQLAEYRAGKDKLFAFFVGQVMKLTRGKANPQLVNDLLKKMLSGS